MEFFPSQECEVVFYNRNLFNDKIKQDVIYHGMNDCRTFLAEIYEDLFVDHYLSCLMKNPLT